MLQRIICFMSLRWAQQKSTIFWSTILHWSWDYIVLVANDVSYSNFILRNLMYSGTFTIAVHYIQPSTGKFIDNFFKLWISVETTFYESSNKSLIYFLKAYFLFLACCVYLDLNSHFITPSKCRARKMTYRSNYKKT